jgi:hypothetical protein
MVETSTSWASDQKSDIDYPDIGPIIVWAGYQSETSIQKWYRGIILGETYILAGRSEAWSGLSLLRMKGSIRIPRE